MTVKHDKREDAGLETPGLSALFARGPDTPGLKPYTLEDLRQRLGADKGTLLWETARVASERTGQDPQGVITHFLIRQANFDVASVSLSLAAAEVKLRKTRALAAGKEAVGALEKRRASDLEKKIESLRAELTAAMTDPDTDLMTKPAFMYNLQSLIDLKTANPDLKISLLFIDSDGLKAVNDAYGHAAGNQMLSLTADILRASIRDGDFCGRLGGDEFGVILMNASEKDHQNIKSRFKENLTQAPLRIVAGEGQDIYLALSASCGLYEIKTGDTAATALTAADERMYEDKRSSNRRRGQALDAVPSAAGRQRSGHHVYLYQKLLP